MGEKIKAMTTTNAELIFCTFVIGLAMYLSSGVAVGFMLLSFTLLHTSTYPQNQRWRYAKNFLFFYLFMIICLTCFKWVKIDSMKTETRVWKNYQYEIKFYEMMGFKIIAPNRHAPKDQRKALDADPKFFYKYSAEISKSFLMEMGLTVFSCFLYLFILSQQKKINYLSDPEHQKDIKALNDILEHEAFKKTIEDGSDEEGEDKPSAGTMKQKNKQQQEAEN